MKGKGINPTGLIPFSASAENFFDKRVLSVLNILMESMMMEGERIRKSGGR
jgi:hypothetical protein